MREFTKSLSSLSWAMTLFGWQQMTNLMRPPDNGMSSSKVTDAFDAVMRSTQDQLGGALSETFQTGDKLQRSMLDLMFAMFGGQAMGSMMPGAGDDGHAVAGRPSMRRVWRRTGPADGWTGPGFDRLGTDPAHQPAVICPRPIGDHGEEIRR